MLPPHYNGESTIEINGKDFHYLVNVLRLKEGSPFTSRDKNGVFFELTITSISQNSLIANSVKKEDSYSSSTDTLCAYRGYFPEIHLFQGLPKGKKMESIIRQCTEIGIMSITPLISTFCVADISRKEESKIIRYQSVVKEALQQSSSPVMTKINHSIDIKHLVKSIEYPHRLLVLHQIPKENPASLFSIITNLITDDKKAPIYVVIGPEGGFSEQEVESLVEKGAQCVFLNTNILRTETAAIVSVSIIQQFIIDILSHN